MSATQAPPTQQPSSPQTAQCFHCKGVKEVRDGHVVVTENNRLRLSGSCAECGSKVSKFVPNPDKPAVDANAEKKVSSPSGATKKIQKKKSKKQILKKCAQCACLQHSGVIDAQPKKERKASAPKRKELDVLKEKIEAMEKHLSLRHEIQKAVDEPKTPHAEEEAHQEMDIGLTAE